MEGLPDVVVRSRLEPLDLVAGLVARRQDDHGQAPAGAPDLTQDGHAIQARQPEVEDQEVEVLLKGELAGADAVADNRRRIALERNPFSRNEASRSSSSAIRMRVIARGRPPSNRDDDGEGGAVAGA